MEHKHCASRHALLKVDACVRRSICSQIGNEKIHMVCLPETLSCSPEKHGQPQLDMPQQQHSENLPGMIFI